MGLPVLIGAGVGGLTSALRGKNILKGAALGGALGGVGSGVGSLMNGGSFLEGVGLNGISGAAGDTLSQGAGGLLGATGSAGTGASLIPTIAESATPAISGSIGSDGLVQIGDTFYNPEYFANMSGTSPIYTGTGSLLDKLSMGAQSVGSNFSNPFADGVGIDNLKGAAQVASMYQPTPLQSAPSGSIKVGQAPTGDIYDALRQSGYTLPKRRETNFSLLG
jgi:hypothetical protein